MRKASKSGRVMTLLCVLIMIITLFPVNGLKAAEEEIEHNVTPHDFVGNNGFATVLYHYYGEQEATSYGDYRDLSSHHFEAKINETEQGISIGANNFQEEVALSTDELRFRVVLDYASASPQGIAPKDIVEEAIYDEESGEVILPGEYKDRNITVIFYLPKSEITGLRQETSVTKIEEGRQSVVTLQNTVLSDTYNTVLDLSAIINTFDQVEVKQNGAPVMPQYYLQAKGKITHMLSPLGGKIEITVSDGSVVTEEVHEDDTIGVYSEEKEGIRLRSIESPAIDEIWSVTNANIFTCMSSTSNSHNAVGLGAYAPNYGFGINIQTCDNPNLVFSASSGIGNKGNGGTVFEPSGASYNVDWVKDLYWIFGTCKGDVDNNGRGNPKFDSGFVQVKSINKAAGTITCYYEISPISDYDGHTMQTVQGTFIAPYSMTGTLQIGKKIENEEQIKGNSSYGTVSEAVFKLYRNTDNQEVATLNIGEDGLSNKIEDLEEGAYYLRETTSPKGMVQNDKQYPVNIKSGEDHTWYTADDNKISNIWQNNTLRMWLEKIDLSTNSALPQGLGSFEGAQYTITYYDGQFSSWEALKEVTPLRTWTVATNGAGVAALNDECFISGDKFYRSTTGAITIPIGTLAIIESKAPRGYLVDNTVHIRNITFHKDKQEDVEMFNAPISKEPAMKGGIKLEKVDKELQALNKIDVQGNADLLGVKFDITNEGTNAVEFEGKTFAKGEVVTTIETFFENGKYVARTKIDDLTYSDYGVKEVATNGSYLLSDGIKRVVPVRKHEKYHSTDLDDLDLLFENEVARGDLYFEKWSKETDEREPVGDGTLDGAVYNIINKSEKGVIVEGVFYEPETIVKTVVTENGGTAKTTGKIFPVGEYEIAEIEAPKGYLLSGDIVRRFTIKSEGEIVNLNTSASAIKNESIRADVEFIKIEDGTLKRLSGVPFKFTAKSSGESHIMLTDKNGYLNTSSEWVPHTSNTNRGESSEDGIWFGEGAPSDDKGALLYDTYVIDELPCEANENFVLLEGIELVVDRDGITYKMGTLTNDKCPTEITETAESTIHIGTTFMEEGTKAKAVTADGIKNMVDVVVIDGATVGRRYRLDLVLMDRISEKPILIDEKEITGSTTFVAEEEKVIVKVPVSVDVKTLGDISMVAFETMTDITDEDNKSYVAEHKDINYAGQTITVVPLMPEPEEEPSDPGKAEVEPKDPTKPKVEPTDKTKPSGNTRAITNGVKTGDPRSIIMLVTGIMTSLTLMLLLFVKKNRD